MSLVTQVKRDGFDIIRLQTPDGFISMEINPSRGNIISSLIFRGKEMIHIDPENYRSTERPRCGCPVLFPFFGRNEDNQLQIDGRVYPTDIHGVVHTNRWIVDSLDENEDKCSVELYTTSNDFTRQAFPYDFRLDTKISLQGNEVVYEMKITNLSQSTMPCDLGFHPFFKISHLNNLKFDAEADTAYNPETKNRKKYEGIDVMEVKGSGFILENCRSLRFTDEVGKVCMTIDNRKEFENFMLWTGNEAKFLVIEPLTSVPNAINDKVNKFNLSGGESVELAWSFKLDAI